MEAQFVNPWTQIFLSRFAFMHLKPNLRCTSYHIENLKYLLSYIHSLVTWDLETYAFDKDMELI